MATGSFPGGLKVYGMPIMGGLYVSTGDAFFVHHSGSNNNSGTDADSPLATLEAALAKCSSSTKDMVFLMPGHAETLSATVLVSKIGVGIIGIGNGFNRPTITTATTGSDNALEITVADVKIENIYFKGTNGTGTNEVFIDVQAGADRFELSNCVIRQEDKNLDAITIAGGADDVWIHDCKWYAGAAGPDTGISIEASINRPHLDNLMFFYEGSSGADEGCIRFEAGGSIDCLIENVKATGLADGQPFIYMSDASTGPTGLILNCMCDHADSSDVWDVTSTNCMAYINCFAAQPGTMATAAMQADTNYLHPNVTPEL